MRRQRRRPPPVAHRMEPAASGDVQPMEVAYDSQDRTLPVDRHRRHPGRLLRRRARHARLRRITAGAGPVPAPVIGIVNPQLIFDRSMVNFGFTAEASPWTAFSTTACLPPAIA